MLELNYFEKGKKLASNPHVYILHGMRPLTVTNFVEGSSLDGGVFCILRSKIMTQLNNTKVLELPAYSNVLKILDLIIKTPSLWKEGHLFGK